MKGVLSKDYARPALDKQRLGELIDLIGTIGRATRHTLPESRSGVVTKSDMDALSARVDTLAHEVDRLVEQRQSR